MSAPTQQSSEFQPLNRRSQRMFQVTFSDQSMAMLNKLAVDEQLKIVDTISSITPEMLEKPKEPIGRFTRDKTYYRVRAGDYRCYFEVRGDTLYCHYVVSKHTLTDFIFRFKLPVNEEQMAEQHSSFWKYLDTLRK